MEFYEAINKRKTTREFLDTEVDFEVIKRILEVCGEILCRTVARRSVYCPDCQRNMGRPD
jgi:hypothetical protein